MNLFLFLNERRHNSCLFSENMLYWCDAGTYLIEKFDLNTLQRTELANNESVGHCFDLAIAGDSVFFTDWGSP